MKKTFQFYCLINLLALATALFAACSTEPANSKSLATGAETFMTEAEKQYLAANIKDSRASWVQSNFITDDTESIAADAKESLIATIKSLADESRKFDGMELSPDVARKIKLLKLAVPLPAPSNPAEREQLTKIAVGMESAYGKFEYCPDAPPSAGGSREYSNSERKGREAKKKCLSLGDLETIMAESRNPEELKNAWAGWHKVSPQYRKDYARFVDLANKGAREMGFKDVGAMWRSNYDMEPDQFAAEMELLWLQVKPLYDSLHTYVRAKLRQKYGDAVPATGPIPAHLLGNMWSQTWGNIYDIVKPAETAPTYDLTKILVEKKTDAKQMARYGEAFFTSLGFNQLPQTFWERSLFTKPQDRDVVCHASAWDIDSQKDVRLKMCIKIDDEDFQTVHHELGHNYYQMAYAPQPPLYQNSANDGFHEAIGDAIALSVTPEYLKKVGLITAVPPESADLGLLMKLALEKVAFLPFGYLVDQWRWKVFSGEVGPGDYNKAWWELRQKYQNIAPPSPRSESDFDAGAKYHIAANVPYARYFLADILQFQFHRAMCREAGYKGRLNRCSIYGNKQVGEKLRRMLEMGQSRPWPEALKALTGEDKMDATAILDYFAPLKTWLDEQNQALAAK